MPLKSYRELEVWQKAVSLVCDVYAITAKFPREERYGITSQLRRAAVSIPCNIAEGYGRETRGEYLNQLSVASGSANELERLCIVSEKLGLTDVAKLTPIVEKVVAVQRMLARLRSRLRQRAGSRS
jgi:four helix bundle protein